MRKIESAANWIRSNVEHHLSSEEFYEALGITWFPEISDHAISCFAEMPDHAILNVYEVIKKSCPPEITEEIDDDEPNYIHFLMANTAYDLSKKWLIPLN